MSAKSQSTGKRRARKSKSGRKRKASKHMTTADKVAYTKKVRSTTKNSHKVGTRTSYVSYMRGIDEWYSLNHPDLCDEYGELDCAKMRKLTNDPDELKEQGKIFKIFIRSRKHHSDVDADGNPCIARVGSLNGYRSAWAYYVWGGDDPQDDGYGVPPQWDAAMKNLYKGLKHEQAERKQKGLLNMKVR